MPDRAPGVLSFLISLLEHSMVAVRDEVWYRSSLCPPPICLSQRGTHARAVNLYDKKSNCSLYWRVLFKCEARINHEALVDPLAY